jgi:hypothetical protein
MSKIYIENKDVIKARKALIHLKHNYTWREIKDLFYSNADISYATLRNFAHGKNPGVKTLRALGLPIHILTPVCPRCDVVHVRVTCPKDGSKPRPVRAIAQIDQGLKDVIVMRARERGISQSELIRQVLAKGLIK